MPQRGSLSHPIKRCSGKNIDFNCERYIADRAEKKIICLDASEELLTALSGFNFRVKEIVVDKPCKLLDILAEKIKREIMEGEVVKEEEVRELVGDHLRLVEMIMEKGYEEAYRMWQRVFDKYKNLSNTKNIIR